MIRTAFTWLLAAFFVATGTLHFVKTGMFVRMVPPGFPAPLVLDYISGACELLGAIGVLIPRLRRAAGFGLIVLLLAVFPANISMAFHPAAFSDIASPATLWWRLPLQFVIIAWVWYACLAPVHTPQHDARAARSRP